MENSEVEHKGNGTESSYKIIRFTGSEIPERYRNMLYSKFLRSLKYGNDWFRMVDKDAYFTVYHAFVGTLFARQKASVKLAVLSDDYDNVLGWSLAEPGVLHYVYVNHEFRKQGIARALCTEPFSVVTHMTGKGAIIFKKMKDVTFNPWAGS